MDNDDRTTINGAQLLVQLFPHLFIYSTGSASVDQLCGGGVMKGEIMEIVGDIACGKTQMCLSAITDLLIADGIDGCKYVVWLDSNGSFRADRLRLMLIDRLAARGVGGENVDQLLNRVLLRCVADVDQLMSALNHIQTVLTEQMHIAMLIIDSVGGCLYGTTTDYITTGRNAQLSVIVQLRKLAITRQIAIIMCNHLVYWSGHPSPALGQCWINAPQRRLYLFKVNRSDICVRLISSDRLPYSTDNQLAQFAIRACGICDERVHTD